MMVMSVASSHHRSIPGTPRVTARLNANATVMASEISVIIPGSRSRISCTAPRKKTKPPYKKRIDPNTAGTYRDPGNAGAVNPNQSWTIGDHTTVGIVSKTEPQNLSRNIETL